MTAELPEIPSSASSLIAQVIDGRYRVERKIGAGGMGEVFIARQLHVDRAVALKVLPPQRALDKRARAQFVRETKAISQLTSPHTVTLYDAGHLEDGAPYLAMELLEGMTLRKRLAQAPMDLQTIVRIVDGIALSLAEAHARGILHLDIKPSNVFLSHTPEHADQVKVLDFGLARLMSSGELNDHAAGTLRYMAPETLSGGHVDMRTDVYALGMVAYELLAAEHPFEGLKRDALIDAQLSRQPAAVDQRSHHALPPDVPLLLARSLAKPARLRPADASMFRRAWRAAFKLPEPLLSNGNSSSTTAASASNSTEAPTSETAASIELKQQKSIPAQKKHQPSDRHRGWLAAAVFVLLLAAGIYQTSRSTTTRAEAPDATKSSPATSWAPAAEPSATNVVTIAIHSTPSGAAVTLDGVGRGQTPLSLVVEKGRVASRLTLSMTGYETHRQTLESERDMTIAVQLSKPATERTLPLPSAAASQQAIATAKHQRRPPAKPAQTSARAAGSTEPQITRPHSSVSRPDNVRERVHDYLD